MGDDVADAGRPGGDDGGDEMSDVVGNGIDGALEGCVGAEAMMTRSGRVDAYCLFDCRRHRSHLEMEWNWTTGLVLQTTRDDDDDDDAGRTVSWRLNLNKKPTNWW